MLKLVCLFCTLPVFCFASGSISPYSSPFFYEFPIAVGDDSALTLCPAAYDGTNYLVGIQGDVSFHANISAQLVSQSGNLVGSRISVGRTGGVTWVAFDGTKYLIVWEDDWNYPMDQAYGQFISTSGNLTGNAFPISGQALDIEVMGGIAFGESYFLVPWVQNDTLFGQLVDVSGNLFGAPIKISDTPVFFMGPALAFDGTNFLVVWPSDPSSVYGQLISKSGVLVGNNIPIDVSSYSSNNPVSVFFDGSRYIVCFSDRIDTVSQKWDIFARFVTTSGNVAERVTIVEAQGEQVMPSIAFDGTNYLITWMNNISYDYMNSRGRFFNTAGNPVGSEFTVFDTLNNERPAGAFVAFGGYQYLAITTRGMEMNLEDGDIFGAFVPAGTGVEEEPENKPEISVFELNQNTPNPFKDNTIIRFELAHGCLVELSVYSVSGQKIKTLVNEYVDAGVHTCAWNGGNEYNEKVNSGIYFLKMRAGNTQLSREIIIIH